MVRERQHAPGRTAEAGVRADEDPLRPGADEAVDEVLGQLRIDLLRGERRPLAAVEAWVVHVDVEPVLVGRVADAAEARAKEIGRASCRERVCSTV